MMYLSSASERDDVGAVRLFYIKLVNVLDYLSIYQSHVSSRISYLVAQTSTTSYSNLARHE
jgi:hypothetical protein